MNTYVSYNCYKEVLGVGRDLDGVLPKYSKILKFSQIFSGFAMPCVLGVTVKTAQAE